MVLEILQTPTTGLLVDDLQPRFMKLLQLIPQPP